MTTTTGAAKIGLLGLMPELYERIGPQTRQKQDGFARQMAATWDFAQVVWPGVCNSRELVDAAVRRFEQEQCDLIVVVCLTYAPSLISVSALCETFLPVVLLDTQPDVGTGAVPGPDFFMLNHGVHGIQDLANVLLRGGRKAPIVVGDWRDAETVASLRDQCQAAHMRGLLRRMRLGIVGRPMAGMGDFAVDETAFAWRVGPLIIPVEPARIAKLAEEAAPAEVAGRIAENKKIFDVSPELTEAQHEAAVRTSLALEKITREDRLAGMAVHFLTVSEDGRVPTLPFLAASRLLADGYGYAGEGDVACASLVAALQKVAGPANFTEMFCIDFADGSVVMAHMGECNYLMARKDRKPRLVPRPFNIAPTPFPPATPAFVLEPGAVTLASLCGAPGGTFRMVIAEGRVMDWGPFDHVAHPHFKFAPAAKLNDFLRSWSESGGSHHQALIAGNRVHLFTALAKMMGIEAVVVG
ncbi:MAG: hypothetical protein IT443_07470 [Phycisphaeraceae bacterium]|nr:hypothetical protein [Phycisphaeraceae bacterium]